MFKEDYWNNICTRESSNIIVYLLNNTAPTQSRLWYMNLDLYLFTHYYCEPKNHTWESFFFGFTMNSRLDPEFYSPKAYAFWGESSLKIST